MAAYNSWHLVSISIPSWMRFVSVLDLTFFCSLKCLECSSLILFSGFTVKKKKGVNQKIFKEVKSSKEDSFNLRLCLKP